ncbi:MAG: DUF3322 domain-containing protein [Desulfosarcina sp.]
MTSWTRPQEIRTRLQKLWNRGTLLSTQLTAQPLFPMRMPLKYPTPRELGDHFGEVKTWIEELVRQSTAKRDKTYDIEWREINHRQLGRNRLPVAAVFEGPADALGFIGKQGQASAFEVLCRRIIMDFPDFEPWLARKPLVALRHLDSWPGLTAVLRWLTAHPRPGIYIRQLEIAGVDTKFIEGHKKLLAELLDILLPPEAIDQSAVGVSGFEQRYGFRSKPVQIRFRLLDADLFIGGLSDLQIPADDVARLDPADVERIFITENDINGLAFPAIKRSMVVFGLGYGLERLAASAWMNGRCIYYWGDIDTHGFAMLDQIRHYFPHTRSMLMDLGTLMDHRPLWGAEKTPLDRDLSRLNPAEAAVYDGLRRNRWAPALRLEQERVSYTRLKAALGGAAPAI